MECKVQNHGLVGNLILRPGLKGKRAIVRLTSMSAAFETVNRYAKLLSLLAVPLCFMTGCGPQGPAIYPVKGKVVYDDGTPLSSEAVIEFEALDGVWSGRNARGLVKEDGTFTVTTVKRHDGAVAGRHRVIVSDPYRGVDPEEGGGSVSPQIDKKFASYNTSELEVIVEEKENELTIEVTRP